MQNHKATSEVFVNENVAVFTEVTKLKKENCKLHNDLQTLQDKISESETESDVSLTLHQQNKILSEELNLAKNRIKDAEKYFLELSAQNKSLQQAVEVFNKTTPTGIPEDLRSEINNTKNLLQYKYPNLKFSSQDILYIYSFSKLNKLDITLNDFWIVPYGSKNTIVTSIGALRKIACQSGRYGLKFFFVVKKEDNTLEKVEFFENNNSIVGCQAIVTYISEGELLEVSRYILRSDFSLKKDYKSSQKVSKSSFWDDMPSVMLQKVAEASVLRSVFPQLSSVYIADEMPCNDEQEKRFIVSCDGEEGK